LARSSRTDTAEQGDSGGMGTSQWTALEQELNKN
jgi:hypothetical protein